VRVGHPRLCQGSDVDDGGFLSRRPFFLEKRGQQRTKGTTAAKWDTWIVENEYASTSSSALRRRDGGRHGWQYEGTTSMDQSDYAKVLEWFKENEKPEPVLLVANTPRQLRIVVAWTNMAVKRARRLSKPRSSAETDRWDWLWENTRFSRKELLAKSASPEDCLDTNLSILIGNRVLYPDGTINSFVQRYLHERVLKLLGGRNGRQ